MKERVLALVVILLLSGMALSVAHAQDANNLDNPNNSSYPASNQLNALPNEPDHASGNDSSIHKLPADVPSKNTRVIYDHPAASTAGDKPVVPADTGVTVPAPPSGDGGKP